MARFKFMEESSMAAKIEFALALVETRKVFHLSQRELAVKMGVDVTNVSRGQTVWKYENRKCSCIEERVRFLFALFLLKQGTRGSTIAKRYNLVERGPAENPSKWDVAKACIIYSLHTRVSLHTIAAAIDLTSFDIGKMLSFPTEDILFDVIKERHHDRLKGSLRELEPQVAEFFRRDKKNIKESPIKSDLFKIDGINYEYRPAHTIVETVWEMPEITEKEAEKERSASSEEAHIKEAISQDLSVGITYLLSQYSGFLSLAENSIKLAIEKFAKNEEDRKILSRELTKMIMAYKELRSNLESDAPIIDA